MVYLNSHKRPWIFPTLATVGFLLLLTHRSESPAVFNRYSINFTILLTLAAINLGLSWCLSFLRISPWQLIKLFSGRQLISMVILILSVAFLTDLLIGVSGTPIDWVIVALAMCIFMQAKGLRRESIQISGNLVLCACSLVCTVVILELIFALFLLESRTPGSEAEFLRLMTSNHIRKHNSAWPQPISVTKAAGTFRILGLSDSFGTYGGVTNYHYQLEDILRRDVSPKIQMVNISVSAYEPKHQLAILPFGMAYSPDLVLHGFFIGNDFSLSGDEMYIYLNIGVRSHPDNLRYRPRYFLLRGWIAGALRLLKEEWRSQREAAAGIGDRLGTFSKSAYLKLEMERMVLWAKKADKDIDRMKKILPVLDSIRSSAEEGGARYVMVIHPDEAQVNGTLRREIITTFQLSEDEYDFDLPQKILRSYCADRGILCLDLLPVIRSAAKERDLYLLRDTHYNRDGYELAALTISQFLREKQLIPDRLQTN